MGAGLLSNRDSGLAALLDRAVKASMARRGMRRLRRTLAPRRRWVAVATAAALGGVALAGPAAAVSAPSVSAPSAVSGPRYDATIVRTAYGIPHITAGDFGSLGYGYGYAFASDDLCTMAEGYVTVEGQRSRYFGGSAANLDSDIFWQSIIDRGVIPGLLAVKSGPGAIGPQLRQLMAGYVAGYNRYLTSVGGAAGVPDPACKGQPWVKPITTLDAYLRIYELVELQGQAGLIPSIATAQPPASAGGSAGTQPALPSAAQLRALGPRLSAASLSASMAGSNAIAVGSAGTRDGTHGMLLGNPHFPWDGPDRFYEVQLTIPGTMNVEGAALYGVPLVVIGFTSTMAWSHTVSTAWRFTPYQLALVPGDPTEYLVDGKPEAMTQTTVTVDSLGSDGTVTPVRHTLWYTRYGPVFDSLGGLPLPWSSQTAFALADVNAQNFRFLNHFLATDEAQSVAQELSILKKYQGLPWVNTMAADSTGHALYADIGAIPDVTDAEAAACDTALGQGIFPVAGLPVLDGSRSACAWGTDPDSATPGIFGPAEEPSLQRRDFVENSNDSFWLSNPAQPLTGFARIIGDTGTRRSLRTRSALAMIIGRVTGSDGLGPARFTMQDMENLMFSDIQYGATLVKPQLVSMCQSLPGGLAPTSSGGTIPVGDSCAVLASWDGRENTDSRGAVLFRAFWENALALPEGPWLTPFDPSNPVGTPNGLNTVDPGVQQSLGDALAELAAARLPYDVALGTVQYVVRNGQRIALPGGPGDPDGEFNAINEDAINSPGVDPIDGSSYIQVVTWNSGSSCPAADSLLTYSESANQDSPHHADQTLLFSRKQFVTTYFCPAQVAAHAVSVTVLTG
jgi:acyl-homoserine-lactone acylase